MRINFSIVFLATVALLGTGPVRAAEVVFEEGVEYANPDEQHLNQQQRTERHGLRRQEENHDGEDQP